MMEDSDGSFRINFSYQSKIQWDKESRVIFTPDFVLIQSSLVSLID
jgi:hypothetical protein